VRCRGCGAGETLVVLDLGRHPHASWFPTADELSTTPTWPLRLLRCRSCGLFQLDPDSPPEIDIEGAPAPTSSATMADHADRLVADAIGRDLLAPGARVIDLASHGGHLAPFMARHGIVPLVLETVPWRIAQLRAAGHSVVDAAPEHDVEPAGIGEADAVVDFYRLAHVPDLAAAVAGIARLLRPGGVAILEFDHALSTIAEVQFDSIRHGHFSYLTLGALAPLLAANRLEIESAMPLSVYGGALRVVARRRDAVRAADGAPSTADASVAAVRRDEDAAGLDRDDVLASIGPRVEALSGELRDHLRNLKSSGRTVAAYGAPTRASTLLNTARITAADIPFTVDRSAAKLGRFIPGAAIPIRSPDVLLDTPPDEILILTWDIADEVTRALAPLAGRSRFVVPLPTLGTVSPAPEPEAA